MNTKQQEKKQEVLLPLITTADAISKYSKQAKLRNMTLGEFALYALEHADKTANQQQKRQARKGSSLIASTC